MGTTLEPINNGRAASHAPREHEITSPFDGRRVGVVKVTDQRMLEEALAGAVAAQQGPFPAHRRAAHLRAVSALIAQSRQELTELIAREGGKPIRLAGAEVGSALDTYQLAAAEALKLGGEFAPMDSTAAGDGLWAFTRRRGAGVVAAICPFNVPLGALAHKVAPAIAAGCPVIVKPATQTPLTALRLAALHDQAGLLPAGFLSVVPGPGAEVASTLAADPRVAVVSFTGSARVGWSLPAVAPRKKLLLELGNSTPVIVHADADLGEAAAQLAVGAYASAGQNCASVQRVIAHESRHERLLALLMEASEALQVGDPLDPDTDVGPVIDDAARTRIRSWVEEAVGRGAHLVRGGGVQGRVIDPVLLSEVPTDCRVWQAEVFGPVMGLVSYREPDEAIDLANSTDHGLQGAVFTRDLQTARQIADGLDFASVLVNRSPTFRADQLPYGGRKGSGNTREGPAYAVREMLEEQLVVLG